MASLDSLTLSEFGGGNARTLAVAGIQASWELSGMGSFSAFTTPEALADAGLWGSLAGKWLTWAHATAGEWGGVCIGKPSSRGLTEIAAEGFAVLARGREVIATPRLDQMSATAGGTIRRALGGIVDGIPTFFDTGSWDESGDATVMAIDGRDLLSDVLLAASNDGGCEWIVDANRLLSFGQTLGVDLSATVVLVENREIVDARLGDDVWAAPASEVEEYEPPSEQAASASILSNRKHPDRKRRREKHHKGGRRDRHKPGRPGRRTVRTVMQTNPGPAAPSLLVDEDTLPRNLGLTLLSVPKPSYVQIDTIPLELTIIDANNAFASTALGNTVRVVVESARFAGQFRIHSRALDTVQGTMTLAGECLSDEMP